MQRRSFLQSASVLLALGATSPIACTQVIAGRQSESLPPFSAAVMRLPVPVPPGADDLATSTQEEVFQKEGRYFPRGFIMGPEGLVLRSPEAQAHNARSVAYLRDTEEEYNQIFGANSIMPVMDTPVTRLSRMVEGEAGVLEASRLLSDKGTRIILHTSMGAPDISWRALKRTIGF